MVHSVHHVERDLKQIQGPVLSIYLNTHPPFSDWRIRLKNGLKRMQEYIERSNPNDVQLFSRIKQKVERKIRDYQTSLTVSFICFASSKQILFYLLQVPVENDFQWNDNASEGQLKTLLRKYPKSGVILLQHNKVQIITTFLGEVTREHSYIFNEAIYQWERFEAKNAKDLSTLRTKNVRNSRSHQIRKYRKIIPRIEQAYQKERWEHVFLTGATDLRNIFKQIARIPISYECAGNFSKKSTQKVLHRTIFSELTKI